MSQNSREGYDIHHSQWLKPAIVSLTAASGVAAGHAQEIKFWTPGDGNPFVDVTLDVAFSQRNRSAAAPGFYDGDGVYRVRFMPDPFF